MALHNASATVGSALPKLDCNAMDACMDYVHSMRVRVFHEARSGWGMAMRTVLELPLPLPLPDDRRKDTDAITGACSRRSGC